MARKPRFTLPGLPQHVIQRGINRNNCFFADKDYYRYLNILGEAAIEFACHIHAYVLMTNHVHLLMTPTERYSISWLMQKLGQTYVQYVNKKYKRSGTLWDGRYKSSLVDTENYVLTCMRYIELNPVRAKMVQQPQEYRWSSFRSNAMGNPDKLLTCHPVYLQLGATEEIRNTTYRRLFDNRLDDHTLCEIRASLNHELVYGSERFKQNIENQTDRPTQLRKAGRPKVKEKD